MISRAVALLATLALGAHVAIAQPQPAAPAGKGVARAVTPRGPLFGNPQAVLTCSGLCDCGRFASAFTM